jgi:hypothetical protein
LLAGLAVLAIAAEGEAETISNASAIPIDEIVSRLAELASQESKIHYRAVLQPITGVQAFDLIALQVISACAVTQETLGLVDDLTVGHAESIVESISIFAVSAGDIGLAIVDQVAVLGLT